MGLIDWIVNALTGPVKRVGEAVAGAASDVGATGRPCGLERRFALPNRCRGVCPAGQTCVAIETERYLGVFKQAKTCMCAHEF